MSTVTFEVDLPEDWAHLCLPPALDARLTSLLDQQDRTGGLEEIEQREAEALCNLVDMLAFEDDTTVSGDFQAHTFEDRVLKIGRVTIRDRASVGTHSVLFYGADIGPGARVSPHSVVLKGERLAHDRDFAGVPTQPV